MTIFVHLMTTRTGNIHLHNFYERLSNNRTLQSVGICLNKLTHCGRRKAKHTSDQGRNEGGKEGHNSPGTESLREALKTPNNVTTTFFNTVHLLPKDLRFKHGDARFKHGGAKLGLAGSNMGVWQVQNQVQTRGRQTWFGRFKRGVLAGSKSGWFGRFKHGGAKLASCPERHLTSLRHCERLYTKDHRHGARGHQVVRADHVGWPRGCSDNSIEMISVFILMNIFNFY